MVIRVHVQYGNAMRVMARHFPITSEVRFASCVISPILDLPQLTVRC
jgi:hypothetical protein